MHTPKSSVFSRALKNTLWSRTLRDKLQMEGINVTPVNFYATVPSIAEIESSFEYADGAVPYLDDQLFDHTRMLQQLAELTDYSADFAPDEDGNEETCENGFFWKNSQFSYSDAMSYYSFVRKLKPGRIVEIGSGFSTLVATQAVKENGRGSITCIEPFPRPFLKTLNDITLIPRKAQDISAAELDDMLEDGDVLFIDSTHTVKTGSDCAHIYLRLLPRLTKTVYVHIHDIFLPFGMPKEWLLDLHIYWTEQYLVHAWLLDNPRATVLYGSCYHEHFSREALAAFMHGRALEGGSSLWLKYDGSRR